MVASRIAEMSRAVLETFKSGDSAANPLLNGKLVQLWQSDSEIAPRDLVLHNGHPAVNFIQADQVRRIIVPIKNVYLRWYKISGHDAGRAFDSPNPGLYLKLHERISLSVGEVFVRVRDVDVVEIESGDDVVFITYNDLNYLSTYNLAFDDSDLTFLGTSMTDISAAKSIALLEILELLGSEYSSTAAYKLIEHRSPIVRWRALSALNRSNDERTTKVLEKFLSDPTFFVARGARRVLDQGVTR